MAALDYLRCAGLAVELEGSWLSHRQYLREHRAELIVPMTRDEALAEALWLWPDADIVKE
jgi:hypothetical protein